MIELYNIGISDKTIKNMLELVPEIKDMTEKEQKQATKQFAEYWKDKGYEKGEGQKFWLSLLRNVFGVEHPEELAVDAPFSPAGGYSAVHHLLQDGKEFTAILCANDLLAVGALKALKEHRLRVPKDVSLIGINDMETSRYLDPMLTTVAIPMHEMGQHVAKMLIDRIQGGHTAPVKLILPSTLICRESCAAVKET